MTSTTPWKDAGRGAVAAAVTLTLAALLPVALRIDFLAAILALTAGIYLGFAFVDARPARVRLESAVGLAFMGLAVVGAWWHPALIALGFVLHVPWDLAHHPRAIDTRIASWVPPFCLVYDLAVAAGILAWWPPFA